MFEIWPRGLRSPDPKGPRIPIFWQRGLRGPSTPLSFALTKAGGTGVFSPRIFHFPSVVREKLKGILSRKLLFPGRREIEVLDSETLFSRKWEFGLLSRRLDSVGEGWVGVGLGLGRGWLRSPAAILFIPRDTCSDSIAKLFRAFFFWGIAQLSRDTLQNGVSHRCASVKLSTKGGIAPFWGGARLP